uniref:Uncharacterized protein n=1 Tax=Ignisphaera aggregans TaxID=334771 RepID=A0A7J2TB30_9CREN
MGKFERGEAEKLEKDVVDLLNSRGVQAPHICSQRVSKRIREDFDVRRAEFIGRTYSEPGNIKLFLADGRVAYIELKLVESGKGTRANLGQNALTEFGLFEGDVVLSWQEFRRRKNFDGEVLKRLNTYSYYDKVKLSKYRGGEKERKARYLRDILRPKPGEAVETAVRRAMNSQDPALKQAAKIVEEILELARVDKLEYIEYLRSLRQDPKSIKRFTILILLGIHKEDNLRKAFREFDQLIKSLKEELFVYRTYYIRKRDCEICAEDLTTLISKLLRSSDFRITFPPNETCCVIEYRDPDSGAWEKLLRVVFHWKNVFQGIATPCLNIFDEGVLKETCFSSR